MKNINLQDFTINLYHLDNIKRNWNNKKYTYIEYENKVNKYIKKHTLDNKIKFKIYTMKGKYYLSYNYIKDINTSKFSRGNIEIPILRFINKYLFTNEIFTRTLNFEQLKLQLKYKYIQFNNKIIKVFNLNNLMDKEELNILYKLFKSNNFEEDLIKICGTKNNEEQDYYRFIFKNIQFNFIEYKSDIDKIKEEYDKKIKDLNNKLISKNIEFNLINE